MILLTYYYLINSLDDITGYIKNEINRGYMKNFSNIKINITTVNIYFIIQNAPVTTKYLP